MIRGGKSDNAPLLKKAEKILPIVQGTSDVGWLFSVYNRFREIAEDESLKPEEADIAKNIAAEAAGRLFILGHDVADQKDSELVKKTEQYNV